MLADSEVADKLNVLGDVVTERRETTHAVVFTGVEVVYQLVESKINNKLNNFQKTNSLIPCSKCSLEGRDLILLSQTMYSSHAEC